VLIPAIWWLLYPLTMILWVSMWAVIQGKVIVPIGLFIYRLIMDADDKKKKGKQRKKKQKDGSTGTDENDDEWSTSSSEEDDEQEDRLEKEIAKHTYYFTPTWSPMSDQLVPDILRPDRFSTEFVSKESQQVKPQKKRESNREERILMLFREDADIRTLLTDIAPWLVVTLNNVWNPVTTRLVQLLSCKKFKVWGGVEELRLLAQPDMVCFEGTHFILTIISIAGLLFVSFGIVSAFYGYVAFRDLKSKTVQRNFGYLLEGYEPRAWWWEILVRKLDLLAAALITYTSIAPELKSKILLYAVLASTALGLQISIEPFDDRKLHLLDTVEKIGLFCRYLLFTGLSICILIDTRGMNVYIAAVMFASNIVFFVKLSLHAGDDWFGTQVIMVKEAKARILFQREERRNRLAAAKAADTLLMHPTYQAKKRSEHAKKHKKKKEEEEDAEVDIGIILRVRTFFCNLVQQKHIPSGLLAGPVAQTYLARARQRRHFLHAATIRRLAKRHEALLLTYDILYDAEAAVWSYECGPT
jgi:hypothetical protein